jgi:hypothetical protein
MSYSACQIGPAVSYSFRRLRPPVLHSPARRSASQSKGPRTAQATRGVSSGRTLSSLKPIGHAWSCLACRTGYTRSYLACRTGRLVPVWGPHLSRTSTSRCIRSATSTSSALVQVLDAASTLPAPPRRRPPCSLPVSAGSKCAHGGLPRRTELRKKHSSSLPVTCIKGRQGDPAAEVRGPGSTRAQVG